MASRRPPRGRLPQRVYWVRRCVVLLVAFLLVLGIARLVGATGSDGTPDRAATTGATTSPSTAPSQGPSLGPVAPTQGLRTKAAQPLLAPTGVCQDDAVSAVPVVRRVDGGRPVALHVRLEGTAPACTFAVSPESLVVKITSGPEANPDRIWSTQDCPQAISTDSVVVRSGVPTDVVVTWSGRRSDSSCSTGTTWALPGFYHVYAAAFGSAPSSVQFEVVKPRPRVIHRTAKPSPTPTATPTPRPTPTPSQKGKHHGGSVCGGDNAASTC